MNQQRYTVKVVFRGLCLARREPSRGLTLFLPDASILPRPKKKDADANGRDQILRLAGRLREHHAALEFFQADWKSQSAAIPRLLQVTKPTKEPTAIYLLKKQEIFFQGIYQHEAALPSHPELLFHQHRYTKFGEIYLLDKDHEHGFDQLPGYYGEIEDDARQNSAAVTLFSVGEAMTERRSRQGDSILRWREVEIIGGKEVRPPRPINLDIVIRFTLPAWNPLQITCAPIKKDARSPGDERTFILMPSDLERGITVWVKNRELSAILLDSDLLPDPYEADCPFFDTKDRDHALFALLAKFPERMTFPRETGGNASDCGSGCGCSDTRPRT